MTSAHFGGHSGLKNRAFSGVENSIFGIERRRERALEHRIFFWLCDKFCRRGRGLVGVESGSRERLSLSVLGNPLGNPVGSK